MTTKRGAGHRVSPNGSFMIDKIMKGVGRIHHASGITREGQWKLFKAALEDVNGDEKWVPALLELKAKRVSAVAFLMAYKKGSPTSLVAGEAGKPLVQALADWREATHAQGEVSDDTYRVRKELVEGVRSVVTADAPIAALPDALRMLRSRMEKAPRSFNLMRDYARAFARDTLGRRHEVYLAIADLMPRKVTKRKGKAVTETTNRALTPREVARLAAAFDSGEVWRAKKGSRGGELISMVLAGNNPKEYFAGANRTHVDRVHISGTKRGGGVTGRTRDIPRLFPTPLWPHDALAQPTITQSSFARALPIACAATGIRCTPYDMRRTFANWLEAAGVLRVRRRMYLGHEAGDVSELYERHEVARFLMEDGLKVREWIIAQMEATDA